MIVYNPEEIVPNIVMADLIRCDNFSLKFSISAAEKYLKVLLHQAKVILQQTSISLWIMFKINSLNQ